MLRAWNAGKVAFSSVCAHYLLRRSCVSSARNAGKVKLRFLVQMAQKKSDSEKSHGGVENARFGRLHSSFSVFVKVSWKTLGLEVWIPTFCELFVENARFFRMKFPLLAKVSWKPLVLEVWNSHFLRMSLLVLEVWIRSFCECLVENTRSGSVDSHFLRKSRGKLGNRLNLEVYLKGKGKGKWKLAR